MLISRISRSLITVALVVTLLCSFSMVALADTTTPTPTPTPSPTLPPELKLKCDLPSYSENSATSFYYNVELTYSGSDTITVNLSTTPPQGWSSYVTYSSKEVTSIPIGPMAYGSPDSKTLSVNMTPKSGQTPGPGQYTLTLKATSGDMSKSIELRGEIKSKYTFSMYTPSGNLATKATAGKVNNFSIEISNIGSSTLKDINLNASNPNDWLVKFEPDKISSLDAGQKSQINVVITPPKDKTIAGDYNVTLGASNTEASNSMVIRVTVETPTIWGIIAIIIIVVVIAGLAFLFLKLGRR
jgi:uncharacterized membrane protein